MNVFHILRTPCGEYTTYYPHAQAGSLSTLDFKRIFGYKFSAKTLPHRGYCAARKLKDKPALISLWNCILKAGRKPIGGVACRVITCADTFNFSGYPNICFSPHRLTCGVSAGDD